MVSPAEIQSGNFLLYQGRQFCQQLSPIVSFDDSLICQGPLCLSIKFTPAAEFLSTPKAMYTSQIHPSESGQTESIAKEEGIYGGGYVSELTYHFPDRI